MFGAVFARSTQTDGAAWSSAGAGAFAGLGASTLGASGRDRGSSPLNAGCRGRFAKEWPVATNTSASLIAPWNEAPAFSVSCHGEIRDPRTASTLERYQLVADLGDFEVYELIADGAARSGRPPGVQPGTRDIIPARQTGGVRVRIGDPGVLLALLAFAVSAICASIVEKGRVSPRVAPGSA